MKQTRQMKRGDEITRCREKIRKLEGEVAFLGNWSFVPGQEPSSFSKDVVIFSCISDGSEVRAHQLILANRSDVLRKKIEELIDPFERIYVKASGKSVKLFVKFLYTAKLSDDDMHANYRELVELAHLYQVELLLLRLDKFICAELLKKDSLVEFLKMAYQYDLEATREAAHDLLVDDVDECFDKVYHELLEDDSGLAFDLSKYIFNRLRKKIKAT